MTKSEAEKIIGKHPKSELFDIEHRLASSNNLTDDDWKRLKAVCVLLGERASLHALIAIGKRELVANGP